MHLSSRAAGYGAESKISKTDLLVEYNRLLRVCNDDKIRNLLKEVVNYKANAPSIEIISR